MKFATLACIAMLLGSAFAQTKHAEAPSSTISHYMRETGLLYLQDVEAMVELGLQNPKAELMLDPEHGVSNVNMYGKALQVLEDHIRINITSESDAQYLKLLQRTKAAAELDVIGGLSVFYSDCYAQSRATSLEGRLVRGSCTKRAYELAVKAVDDAGEKAAAADLAKAQADLADARAGNPKKLSPIQTALCAKDSTFDFCAGTPEAEAKWRADKDEKTQEFCDKGVFDKDYCAKYRDSQNHPLILSPANPQAGMDKQQAAQAAHDNQVAENEQEHLQSLKLLADGCRPYVGKPYSEWPSRCAAVSEGLREWQGTQKSH